MTVSLEHAAVSDLPAIAELYQDAFPEALQAVFGRTRVPSVLLQDILGILFAFDARAFWVAHIEGQLAGFMIAIVSLPVLCRDLLWKGSWLKILARFLMGRYAGTGFSFIPVLGQALWNYRRAASNAAGPKDFAQILSVVVDARWRRQGIGRSLTDRALGELLARGVPCIRLEVHAQKSEAVSLYRSEGFQEIGRMKSPRGEALIMIRYLQPATVNRSIP